MIFFYSEMILDLLPLIILCLNSRETEKKKLKLGEQCQELNHNLKQTENKTKKMLEEKEDVMRELEGKRTLLENKEQESNHLTTLLEFSKENEAVALGERLLYTYCFCILFFVRSQCR